MILTSPTFVKRNGERFRVDGIHANCVFMQNYHMKGVMLDLSTGVLQSLDYHPFTLLRHTYCPRTVCKHLGISAEIGPGSLEFIKTLRKYEGKLQELASCGDGLNVLYPSVFPVLEALITGVSAKEIYQGTKTAFDYEVPKLIVNYLSGGYQTEILIEVILRQVCDQFFATSLTGI